MRIEVSLPSMLQDSIGERKIVADVKTLAQVMEVLCRHLKLGPLIFDESGTLRKHVLVFYNDTATRHLTSLDIVLRPGDSLSVVQAVSGG